MPLLAPQASIISYLSNQYPHCSVLELNLGQTFFQCFVGRKETLIVSFLSAVFLLLIATWRSLLSLYYHLSTFSPLFRIDSNLCISIDWVLMSTSYDCPSFYPTHGSSQRAICHHPQNFPLLSSTLLWSPCSAAVLLRSTNFPVWPLLRGFGGTARFGALGRVFPVIC